MDDLYKLQETIHYLQRIVDLMGHLPMEGDDQDDEQPGWWTMELDQKMNEASAYIYQALGELQGHDQDGEQEQELEWDVVFHPQYLMSEWHYYEGDWAVLVDVEPSQRHRVDMPMPDWLYVWRVVKNEGELATGQYYDPASCRKDATAVFRTLKKIHG